MTAQPSTIIDCRMRRTWVERRPGPVWAALLAAGAIACSPTVRVEAPEEPIEINLNIRIQQEVRIRIDEELKDLFDESEDIF